MGHGITAQDEVMSVREPMWHGLGHVLEEYPTRVEAQRLVHPWEVVQEPLYRRVPMVGQDGSLTETYQEVETHVANTRSDDDSLLGVVGNTWAPVLNTEMWDVAEALEGGGDDVMIETAGSLKGGAKVWVLLRLKEALEVPGDGLGATVPYYALQNDHSGMGSFRGQATMTRIVCQNTASMADLDAKDRGTEFVFRHTKTVRERIEEARQALFGWRRSVEDWRQLNEVLMADQVTEAGVQEFIERFIPEPLPGAASERVIANAQAAQRQLRQIIDGPTVDDTVAHTAYGLVNAAVEWSIWARKARSAETRFYRTYLSSEGVAGSARKIAANLSA